MEKIKMFLGYTEYGEVMFMEFETRHEHREFPTLDGKIWKCKPWLINSERVRDARNRMVRNYDVDNDYIGEHYGRYLERNKMVDKWVEDTEFWDIDYLFPHTIYDKIYTKEDFNGICEMGDKDFVLFKNTSVSGIPSALKLHNIDKVDKRVLMHIWNYYDCNSIPRFWLNEIEEISKKCGTITEEIEKEIKTIVNKMI